MGLGWLRLSFVLLAFGFVLPVAAHAGDLAELGLAYNSENQVLSGEWPGVVSWYRWPCEGYYRYDIKFQSHIDDTTTFEFNEDGSIEVDGHFSNVYAGVDGAWKSRFTACREVSGWLGAGMDWVHAKAHLSFPGDASDLSNVQVDILSGEFGPVRLGKYVPAWLERETQTIVQQEFLKFWQKHLRTWVNEFLSRKAAGKTSPQS